MPTLTPAPGRLLLAVSLGSNLPPSRGAPFDLVPPEDPRARALEGALLLLRRGRWLLRAASPLYETRPHGESAAGHPPYLNACAAFEVEADLEAALALGEEVERAAGRQSKGDGSPRCLDVDLLAAWRAGEDGEALVPLPPLGAKRLQLPHPRLAERAFVLVPLAGILPDAPIVLVDGGPATTPWAMLRSLARTASDDVRAAPRSASFPSSGAVGLDRPDA